MVILFEDTSLIALGFEGPLLEGGQESVLWLEQALKVQTALRPVPSTPEYLILNSSSIRVWKIHWRRDRLPTLVFLGFPGG